MQLPTISVWFISLSPRSAQASPCWCHNFMASYWTWCPCRRPRWWQSICRGWWGTHSKHPVVSRSTYGCTFHQYTEYVKHKYRDAIVVFDGYDSTNTKDMPHQRRSKGNAGTTVPFTADMPVTMKKEQFLANRQNKQRFMFMLREEKKKNNCEVCHASGDADLPIVMKANSNNRTEQNRTEQKLYSTKTHMNYIGFSCHKSSDKENTYKNINYKHTKTTKWKYIYTYTVLVGTTHNSSSFSASTQA